MRLFSVWLLCILVLVVLCFLHCFALGRLFLVVRLFSLLFMHCAPLSSFVQRAASAGDGRAAAADGAAGAHAPVHRTRGE